MYKLLVKIGYKLSPIISAIIPFSVYRGLYRKLIAKGRGDKIHHEPFDRAAHPDGVNMCASLFEGYSLKVSCESIIREIRRADIRVNYREYKKDITEQDPAETKNFHGDPAPYNVNLFHAGTVIFHYDRETIIPPEIFDKRYNIFYYIWELEEPSPGAKALADFFDEFWVPSNHAGSSLKKITNKPVITIPYAIDANRFDKAQGGFNRQFFNLPENKTLLLTMYDATSDKDRKNPGSVILAYKKAFPSEKEDVGIVFKIGHDKEETIAEIKNELKEYKNVYFLTDYFSREQIYSLIKCSDIFISLPKAEGFGLMMAEAMSLGTPVITTGYSAHTEFMTKDSACMVGWEYTPLTKQSSLYQPGAKWAEPGTDDAARYIKSLCEDKALREKMAERAKVVIGEKLNPDKIAAQIQARIAAIYGAEKPAAK